jgi:hypothetical protein
MDMADK